MNIKAYAVVKLSGYNIRRFINLCTVNHIKIWNIKYINPKEYEACCLTDDIFDMKPHLQKTHTRLIVLKRKGYFSLKDFLYKIRMLTAVLVSTAGISALLYARIWNIEIDGNRFLSDITITDYVYSRQLNPGCHKSSDYSRLEKDLEEDFDDIMWCSIYVEGTTLKIDISEGINYR